MVLSQIAAPDIEMLGWGGLNGYAIPKIEFALLGNNIVANSYPKNDELATILLPQGGYLLDSGSPYRVVSAL